MIQAMMGAVVACAVGSGASAATLRFDLDDQGEFVGPSYTEAGLTISAAPGSAPVRVGFGLSDEAGGLDNGVLGYVDGGPSFEWIITAEDPFDLISIDALHIDSPDPVTFVGYSGGNLVGYMNIGAAGAYTFDGFKNLDFAIMTLPTVLTAGDPRFDNLTWTSSVAAVPLPAAGALLGLGLAGLAVIKRPRAHARLKAAAPWQQRRWR